MEVTFPISGVHTHLWLPPLVAFAVSFFSSMAGVSGAFLLLPFQMSVLGFVNPAVSPTNLVFNIVAIPGGVYRYCVERRVIWPLAWLIIAGSVPGVVVGGLIRLHFLPDPDRFKIFAGCVLLYIGARLFAGLRRGRPRAAVSGNGRDHQKFVLETLGFSWRELRFRFDGQLYSCNSSSAFFLSLIVGVLGGVYGIGGGAIIAPFLIGIYNLPVYAVAGATLISTFATSVVGVAFYETASFISAGTACSPDWMLGGLFGVGGLIGTYLGARTQRYVPAAFLRALLGMLLLFVAFRYLSGILNAIN